jgi:hypothetical protein
MKQLAAILVVSLVAIAPVAGVTDPWDVVASGDDNSGTDNELAHGVVQQHDLQAQGGVADQDWYRIGQKPYSSYEVVVDGLGETVANLPPSDLNDVLRLSLVTATSTVRGSSSAISDVGANRRLVIRNQTSSEIIDEYVHVAAADDGCGTSCTSEAIYRITMRETTLLAPRYNNSGTQITVLMLQNGHDSQVLYSLRFFSPGGTLVATYTGSIIARAANIIDTSAIPLVAGTSGTMRIDHNAPYGLLVGKAVALEPATGFSFDTPLVYRPY